MCFSPCVFSQQEKILKIRERLLFILTSQGLSLQTVRVFQEHTSLVRVTAEGLVESLLDEERGGARSLKAHGYGSGTCAVQRGRTEVLGLVGCNLFKGKS